MLRNEVFAPALGIKYVNGNNSAATFLDAATEVANKQCFGSLSCTIAISNKTLAELGKDRFDQALR